VLPAFRSLVAKELIEKYGFTQIAAARKLGTTQAAISYYLDAKRGGKRIKQLEENPIVKVNTSEMARSIARNEADAEKSIVKLCSLCNALRKEGVICKIHIDYVPLLEKCKICPGV
jgi:predicted transcriptional regulator